MNEIYLVTGATSGIGLSTAKQLLEEGYTVIFSSELTEFDLTIANSNKAHFISCDISKEDNVKSLRDQVKEKFGKLDGLVASAGILTPDCNIDELKSPQIDKMIDVNLKGTFYCMRELGKLIQETSEHGSIVTLTSVDGLIGEPYNSIYSATKAGIISLTKSFARHFKDPLVRVNAVAPGLIDTPLTANTGEDPSWTTDLSIIQRMGTSEEIANAIEFLLSDKSTFITGEVLVVDGGFTLK